MAHRKHQLCWNRWLSLSRTLFLPILAVLTLWDNKLLSCRTGTDEKRDYPVNSNTLRNIYRYNGYLSILMSLHNTLQHKDDELRLDTKSLSGKCAAKLLSPRASPRWYRTHPYFFFGGGGSEHTIRIADVRSTLISHLT